MQTRSLSRLLFRATIVLALLSPATVAAPLEAHPANDLTTFITAVAAPAEAETRDSGVPTAFSIAQASLESNWNNLSPLAFTYNNYHRLRCSQPNEGRACVTLSGTNWNTYSSKDAGFLWHGRWLHGNRNYANAFNYIDEPDEFARQVAAQIAPGDPGYAPTLISRIDSYNLTQYDNQETPFVGVYYKNTFLSGTPVFSAPSDSINLSWGTGGPSSPYNSDWNVGSDNFSVRWKARKSFDTGTYRFHSVTDDGVRLWVDGNLLIDKWQDQAPREWTGDISLTSGLHWIRMEYYEHGGGATAQLRWEQLGSSTTCSNQFLAQYYNNQTLSGHPTFTQCENWSMDHEWGTGGPGNGVSADHFSARWTGTSYFSAGSYTFTAKADDGIRVWLDGSLLIDQWRDEAPTTYTVSRTLSAGNHSLELDYYENTGGAVTRFSWSSSTGGGSSTGYTFCANENQFCDFDGTMNVAFGANNKFNFKYGITGGIGCTANLFGDPNPGVAKACYIQSTTTGLSTTTWYSFVNRNSGKCVDARGSSTASGTPIQQYTCNNTYAQQYQFQSTDSGYYRLVNRNLSSAVWDVTGASTANGVQIQLWGWNGGKNQQWMPVAEGNSYYHFVARHTGKCLDVPGASTKDSVQLQQWLCNATGAQSFSLVAH